MSTTHRERGLGAVAAMIVLVLLATLSAAIVRLNWSQQVGAGQDANSARADQAAYAGIQWGLYQALKGSWTSACGAAQTLDLRTDTGFRVTVTCAATSYNEGETEMGTTRTIRLYTISSVACNGSAASCPDNASVASPAYVERSKVVQVVDQP